MPNGMTSAPHGPLGTLVDATVDEDHRPTSIHWIPIDQFVHHIDMEGTCLCGPVVEYKDYPHATVPLVHHWGLDPRYYEDA